jgi:hypothetical protein
MSGQMYEVTIKATGEVRDADGNLLSSQPMETTMTLDADEVAALTEELGEDVVTWHED